LNGTARAREGESDGEERGSREVGEISPEEKKKPSCGL